MKKIFIFFLLISSLLANTDNNHLKFTEKEQAWINKKIPITYVYDIDWAPFEWKNEVNRHTGIISDILNIIAEKSNLKFEAIHTNSWSKAVLLAENNKVDMYSAIPYSADRAKYMNFSSNNIFQYNACFVKRSNDQTVYKNLQEELINKTVAMVHSSSLGNSVKEKYPQAKYTEVYKTEDGFKELESGQIDLFVINSATADYIINTKGYSNLEVAKKIDHIYKLKIAISKSMPHEVLNIIDKTLANIDKNKIDSIYYKWMSPVDAIKINWKIVIYIIMISSIIVLFLIYRQFILYKINKNLETMVQERTNDLEDSKNELKNINTNLELKIKEEVEKNRLQDQQLIQQSRLAQMGEMISMIAHQWRQPLSSISALATNMQIYLELSNKNYKEDELSNKFNNKLKKIDDLVQSLSHTIDDFRDFYKPNKKSEIMKLEDVIEKSLNIIKTSLINNNINIVEEYNSNEEIELYDSEIMHVILNILRNAQDNFKDKQTKDAYIKITTEDRTISICDNGGGISEEIKEKIFDPYFSTKDKKNGTGLGLYMSKTIIEEHHNGVLSVKNINNGVCFIIKLGIISGK